MKLQYIQVLRALAANAVVLCHLVTTEKKYGHGYQIVPDQFLTGEVGVDLFFVISGFVMAYTAAESGWLSFLIARATRIYPTYWVYTTLLLPVFLIYPEIVNSAYDHPPSLLRSYFLFPDPVSPLVGQAWTLVHEIYFYLAFALILALRTPMFLSLGFWMLIVLGPSIAFGYQWDKSSTPVLHLVFHPLTLEFALGAFCGLLIRAKIIVAPTVLLLVATAVFSWEFFHYAGGDWNRVVKFGLPFVVIVYALSALEHEARLTAWKRLAKLGDASYSTYLCHVMVMSFIGRLFFWQPIHNWYTEAIFVSACIVAVNTCGVISYLWIERPTLHVSRKLFFSKTN